MDNKLAQDYDNFKQSYQAFADFINSNKDQANVDQDAAIKVFKDFLDKAGTATQDFLERAGYKLKSHKEAFRQSSALSIVANSADWFEALEHEETLNSCDELTRAAIIHYILNDFNVMANDIYQRLSVRL